ncbi:hypothetical protein BC835DRAFT_1414014 [Cytidiella melzeri]|nr:hypothetical protein BC835DRAFT_1414014 [Cytidiella melzeri]
MRSSFIFVALHVLAITGPTLSAPAPPVDSESPEPIELTPIKPARIRTRPPSYVSELAPGESVPGYSSNDPHYERPPGYAGINTPEGRLRCVNNGHALTPTQLADLESGNHRPTGMSNLDTIKLALGVTATLVVSGGIAVLSCYHDKIFPHHRREEYTESATAPLSNHADSFNEPSSRDDPLEMLARSLHFTEDDTVKNEVD